jgi:hypothetical protein
MEAQPEVLIDYEKLATSLVTALQKSGAINYKLTAHPDAVGVAFIIFDDCEQFAFEVGSNRFVFEKDDYPSWVETVKNSHRTGSRISVTYGEDWEMFDGQIGNVPSNVHDT